MWIIDHVLVKHRIWVTDDESRQLLEFFVCLGVVSIEFLSSGWEKHGVNLGFALVFDPDVLTVECFGEHLAHLLVLAEERREATSARNASAEAIGRIKCLLCYLFKFAL